MATSSYITVKNALEQFAENHLVIKRFKTSFFEQIDNFSSADNTFPILYVVPSDVTFEQYTDRFFFRIYCVDILQKDRSNESAILNDTLLTLRDLYNWLKIADNGLNVLSTARAIPVNNFLVDYTAGWYLDVEVEGLAESNDCSIPFTDNFTLTGYTCDFTYATKFLTCETLEECQAIIDINDRIDGIIISADTFTVGGSYDNSIGTLFLVRNDGELIPITGFTTGSTGPDIYVTGGTFNSGSETLTLSRNDNQTVVITGFTQTDISGLVPYNGAIDNVTLDKQLFIVNTVDDAIAFQVNALADTTPRVDIGIDAAGNGFINLYDKDNNLVTTIDNGVITANSFVVNGGTADQILLADGTLGSFPFDVYVTGGTYSAGSATFTNNTGGTFTVSGFSTGGTGTDTYVTGFTYNNSNVLTIKQNQGQPDLNALFHTVTGLTTNFFDFNTGATVTGGVGRMTWNDTDGTLDLGLKGGNVTLQIGQEQVARVVNKTSPLIDLLEANYQVVVITGATGQRLSVRLAKGDNDANSAGTLGVVTETILRNQEGFITTGGQVKKINTTGSLQGETWNDGDILYLSPITFGAITNIKPVAPQHTVIVGYVEYAHPVNGKIFVKIDNGYELGELHNVNVTGATNGQVLTYSASTGLWIPTTISGGTGGGNSIGELTGDVTAGPASSSSQSVVATVKPNLKTGSFGVTVDGVSSTVQVGQTGFVTMPYSGTITSWSISANAVGSIQFDIWKAAGAIPTIANTIVASAFPTLTANQYINSSTTTGWSLTFNAGDVFGFYVNSATTIKNATLTLQCTKL